jgi:uncharacterized membrane protein
VRPSPKLLLAAGLLFWVVLLFAAPGVLFLLGHFICHQRPERSFFIGGQQLPVCARCTGLYLGAALAIPFGLAAAVAASSRSNRRLLLVAALPTVLTWTLEFAGLVPFSNVTRFACALPLGFAAAWMVFTTMTDGR